MFSIFTPSTSAAARLAVPMQAMLSFAFAAFDSASEVPVQTPADSSAALADVDLTKSRRVDLY